MPKQPKQKGITEYNMDLALYRGILPFTNLNVIDGNIWRTVTRSQPIAMDAITTLTMHIKSKPWDIRAKNANQADELKEDIDYHKEVFDNCELGNGFEVFLDSVIEDFYMTTFGAGVATPRYSDNRLYTFYTLDSATLFPNVNPLLPFYQYVPEAGIIEPIFFSRKELVRMWQFPKTEILKRGWQMPPAEKLYLALEMLNRGDKYYASLLLDTPEAGLLDLGDMSKESAEAWIASFKTLFQGVDAFKIPVLFEHTTPAKYIPFGRAPNDMLFDTITFKYAQLLLAAFGLTAGDIGLKSSNGSLSSDIRDERHSKSTGFGSLKTHITKLCNSLLPKELEFWFIDVDDELLTSKGRARSANGVAFRNLVEGGIVTPKEARQQLVADGLITVPLTEDIKPEDFDILKEANGTKDQLALQREKLTMGGSQGGTGLNKQRQLRGGKLESVQGKDNMPASQGGMGEVKRSAAEISKLYNLLNDEMATVKNSATDVRVRRLIKFALKEMQAEKIDLETVRSAIYNNEVLRSFDALQEFAENDSWYKINIDETEIGDILAETYAKGLLYGAITVRQYLYEEGVISNYDVPDDIILENDEIRNQLYGRAAEINKLINKGTAFYLSRLVFLSLAENNSEELDLPVTFFQNNLGELLDERSLLISNYEDTLAYEGGVLEQYKRMGLTKKMVEHTGADTPCESCLGNIDLGIVSVDHFYVDKMGNAAKTGPFHPECHCTVRFDQTEVLELKPENYYNGK